MVIGRMHLQDGLVLERTHDATRPIRLGLTHGGDPFSVHTPVVWFAFTESEFASAVAHAARRGETGAVHAEALTLLQQDSFEDEIAAARAAAPEEKADA